jgi:preprotein translocase subunit YajC
VDLWYYKHVETKQLLIEVATANLTSVELSQFWDILREKEKALRARNRLIAKASLSVGAQVKTTGLSPKALNGLTGKIVGIKNTRVDIKLDSEVPSWSPARKFVSDGVLRRVPVTAVGVI